MLTLPQSRIIEDTFFANKLCPTQLRCGLALMRFGKSNMLIKISTEYPNKQRPYLQLLEELYLEAVKLKYIQPIAGLNIQIPLPP